MSNNIYITPNNFNHALILLDKADGLILNLKDFSCRSNYYFTLDEIKQIMQSNKNNIKIFVSLSNFIFDKQIPELEKILLAIDQLSLSGILFNDYAIAQIHYELHLKIKLIYQPTTLFTFYGQFDFLQENNISGAVLSNELFSHEVKEIGLKKPKNFELFIQVHGLSLIMFSRWNLISNFAKYTNEYSLYKPHELLLIKELNKIYPNVIYENEYGTHMFTGYCLCLIKYLKLFKEINIHNLYIDTFLLADENSDFHLIEIYNKAKNDLDHLDLYYDILSQQSKYELASGFIGGLDEIKHRFKYE